MKKHVVRSLIAVLVLGLASCDSTVSSGPSDSTGGNDSSPIDVDTESLAQMLSELGAGYSLETLVIENYTRTRGNDPALPPEVEVSWYLDTASSGDWFQTLEYASVTVEDNQQETGPAKDQVVSRSDFSHLVEGESDLLATASLSLSNQVTLESTETLWGDSFNNAFSSLTADNFRAGEAENQFALDLESLSPSTLSALSMQLLGEVTDREIASLTLISDGAQVTDLQATFVDAQQLVDSSTGEVQIYTDAISLTSSVTGVGSEVTAGLANGYPGEVIPELEEAFLSMAGGNYTVEGTWSSLSGGLPSGSGSFSYLVDQDAVVDTSTTRTADQYALIDGSLQGIIFMSGQWYRTGYILGDLPIYDISSVFFLENWDGNYSLDTSITNLTFDFGDLLIGGLIEDVTGVQVQLSSDSTTLVVTGTSGIDYVTVTAEFTAVGATQSTDLDQIHETIGTGIPDFYRWRDYFAPDREYNFLTGANDPTLWVADGVKSAVTPENAVEIINSIPLGLPDNSFMYFSASYDVGEIFGVIPDYPRIGLTDIFNEDLDYYIDCFTGAFISDGWTLDGLTDASLPMFHKDVDLISTGETISISIEMATEDTVFGMMSRLDNVITSIEAIA